MSSWLVKAFEPLEVFYAVHCPVEVPFSARDRLNNYLYKLDSPWKIWGLEPLALAHGHMA